jgi:hypothetical protein
MFNLAVSILVAPNKTLKLDPVILLRELTFYAITLFTVLWAVEPSVGQALKNTFNTGWWSRCLSVPIGNSAVLFVAYTVYCLVESYWNSISFTFHRVAMKLCGPLVYKRVNSDRSVRGDGTVPVAVNESPLRRAPIPGTADNKLPRQQPAAPGTAPVPASNLFTNSFESYHGSEVSSMAPKMFEKKTKLSPQLPAGFARKLSAVTGAVATATVHPHLDSALIFDQDTYVAEESGDQRAAALSDNSIISHIKGGPLHTQDTDANQPSVPVTAEAKGEDEALDGKRIAAGEEHSPLDQEKKTSPILSQGSGHVPVHSSPIPRSGASAIVTEDDIHVNESVLTARYPGREGDMSASGKVVDGSDSHHVKKPTGSASAKTPFGEEADAIFDPLVQVEEQTAMLGAVASTPTGTGNIHITPVFNLPMAKRCANTDDRTRWYLPENKQWRQCIVSIADGALYYRYTLTDHTDDLQLGVYNNGGAERCLALSRIQRVTIDNDNEFEFAIVFEHKTVLRRAKFQAPNREVFDAVMSRLTLLGSNPTLNPNPYAAATVADLSFASFFTREKSEVLNIFRPDNSGRLVHQKGSRHLICNDTSIFATA